MSGEYERVQITGRLKCLSPLSIGTGAMPDDITGQEGQHGNYLDICTYPDETPFIPGTSLRGLLSALLKSSNQASHHANLFGEMRGGQRGENQASNASLLRVYDAKLCQTGNGGILKTRRTRTATDPITGTAKDNSLHEVAQVPINSQFFCQFELDRRGNHRISRAEVETFLGLLNQLAKDNPLARLGRGGNKSEGQVQWRLASVNTLRAKDLTVWLLDDKPNLQACFHDERKTLNPIEVKPTKGHERYQSIFLRLLPQGLWLVDPERPEVKGEPDMICRTETRDGKTCLIVPASSLRGLLRSHCRKILMTLLVHRLQEQPPYPQSNYKADELISLLFGSQQKPSAVILKDAVGENVQTLTQTFNAIDRFHGGVNDGDGALYTVVAAYQTGLETCMMLDWDRLQGQTDWWKGLLLLTLRDAMEGDMALGWGKAKGYGVFTVEVLETANGNKKSAIPLQDLQDKWLEKAEDWVKCLHDKIKEPSQ